MAARRKAAPPPMVMPLPTQDMALQVIKECQVREEVVSDKMGRTYRVIVYDANGVLVPLAVLTTYHALERMGIDVPAVFIGWDGE